MVGLDAQPHRSSDLLFRDGYAFVHQGPAKLEGDRSRLDAACRTVRQCGPGLKIQNAAGAQDSIMTQEFSGEHPTTRMAG